jgi:hypothetical protein
MIDSILDHLRKFYEDGALVRRIRKRRRINKHQTSGMKMTHNDWVVKIHVTNSVAIRQRENDIVATIEFLF